jgi:PhzF family phenazine biosynthesis protein
LSLRRTDLHSSLPVVRTDYLFVPVSGLPVVRRLRPAFRELAAVCAKARLMGVCVFTLKTVDAGSAVHSRFFAPSVGINEDPVTGSANGPLGIYLATIAAPAGVKVPFRELPDGRLEYVGEQGDEIGRRGRVGIRILCANKGVSRASIAGEAVTVFSGTINV